MLGIGAGVKKASEIALSHLKNTPNLGAGLIRGARSLNVDTRVAMLHALAGAGVGAAIGGGTAVVDRDRRLVPGVTGGAFWGAAAGIGGLAMRRNVRGLKKSRMLIPSSDQASRASITSQISNRQLFQNPRRNAAALVGAYGAFGFMRGGSRRKKHYTQFHHGETGRNR